MSLKRKRKRDKKEDEAIRKTEDKGSNASTTMLRNRQETDPKLGIQKDKNTLVSTVGQPEN